MFTWIHRETYTREWFDSLGTEHYRIPQGIMDYEKIVPGPEEFITSADPKELECHR